MSTNATAKTNAARAFLISLRPWEWTKNLVVFTGLVFAYQFRDPAAVGHALLAFAVFCGLSGMAYVINDVCDQLQDRQHPQKRLRPIASGELGGKAAAAGLVVVGVVAAAVSVFLGRQFVVWAAVYVLLNVAYSKWLKHIIFLDVICVAAGFLVRVFAGCAAVGVMASGYAISCVFSLALLLGAGKRRGELLAHGEDSAQHRSVFDHYTERMLDGLLAVAAVATLASYAVFVTSGKHPVAMVYTMALVVLGVGRYLRLLYKGRGADQPARLVWSDWPLLLVCAIWVVTTMAILWTSGRTTPP
ncbi:MAG: UbiA prenyltransferase family protein [Verrucomicrobia bacterium]|nr:UbiA prenyltransferase family protein [Verrucomicrobiota bacterium]